MQFALGIIAGIVIALLLLNPERGLRAWIARYWARVVSLALGVATIAGVAIKDWVLAIFSAVLLTIMVFRGYDQEIESEETITEYPAPEVEPKPKGERKITEIDLSKTKVIDGKLHIEEEE